MFVKQVLTDAYQKLNNAGIKNARLDAELILAHVLNKSREHIVTYPELKLTRGQANNYSFAINRRLNCEPVAYITGHKNFYGLKFIVNKDVLVPRPETELMVDEIIKLANNEKQATIVDVGTGSGCIITALAKNLKSIFKYYAIDFSLPALKIAENNAEKNNIKHRITFFNGNLLEPVLDRNLLLADSKIFIAANLPYLTPAQINSSPSISQEPELALVAGDDGLKYYRQLFKQIARLKKNHRDISIHIFCEIDPSQTESISKLISDELNTDKFEIKKDLAGLDRLVVINF